MNFSFFQTEKNLMVSFTLWIKPATADKAQFTLVDRLISPRSQADWNGDVCDINLDTSICTPIDVS